MNVNLGYVDWMIQSRGAFVVTITISLASGVVGCSSSSTTTNSNGFCATLESRERACGYIGPGKTNCVDYLDGAEPCETKCLAAATCAGIGGFTCGSGDMSVNICMARCIGLEPLTCQDGTTYSGYVRCNGYDDCTAGDAGAGGEDEQGCNGVGYQCRTVDQRVAYEYVCDGFADCSDGTDEPADCAVVKTCMTVENTQISVTRRMVCDGYEDCADGSDEPTDCAPRMCGN